MVILPFLLLQHQIQLSLHLLHFSGISLGCSWRLRSGIWSKTLVTHWGSKKSKINRVKHILNCCCMKTLTRSYWINYEDQCIPNRCYMCIQWTCVIYSVVITWQSNPPFQNSTVGVTTSWVFGQRLYTIQIGNLKPKCGINAICLVLFHLEIYLYKRQS